MSEKGPETPRKKTHSGDFIDWEKLEKTDRYQKHMAAILRAELRKILLPPSLQERQEEALPNINDFEDDMEGYLAEVEKNDPATVQEKAFLFEISLLDTIDSIKRYCKTLNIKLDIDGIIEKAKKTYSQDAILIAKKSAELKREPAYKDLMEELNRDSDESAEEMDPDNKELEDKIN